MDAYKYSRTVLAWTLHSDISKSHEKHRNCGGGGTETVSLYLHCDLQPKNV